jgi:hypothetical protein
MRLLDLFCGRWGWSRAFAARGWECHGYDLVEPSEVPNGCIFYQADVLDIRLPFICDYDFIVASSPCEEFSVHGMKHFHPNPKYPAMGIRLFEHTRALCEASGVPYVMENVRPAQKFVGRAIHRCGPFCLWGTGVPTLMPQGINKGISQRVPGMKSMTRAEITAWRREHDPMWSSSKGEKRRQQTSKAATIPPELANCVAGYAEAICSTQTETVR